LKLLIYNKKQAQMSPFFGLLYLFLNHDEEKKSNREILIILITICWCLKYGFHVTTQKQLIGTLNEDNVALTLYFKC
jgi:hypothetical protein